MVAALLKIVSTGMQDQRLQPPKEQPELSAFLTVMVKAGRFGTQWVRVDFDTRPELGTAAVARLPVQGELVSRVFLVTTMPDIWTIQEEARKFVPQAKSINGYIPLYFTGNGQYKKVIKYVYSPAQTTTGNTAPQGLQLEGLYAGGTYNVKVYLNPAGTEFNDPYQPQGTVQVFMSDTPFKLSDFDLIQNSTLTIAGFSGEASGENVKKEKMQRSFDRNIWTNIEFPNIRVYDIKSILWDGDQYIVGGVFLKPNAKLYLKSAPGKLIDWIQPNIFPEYINVFIAGIASTTVGGEPLYVAVGSFLTLNNETFNAIYSTDGQTWINIPAEATVTVSGDVVNVIFNTSENRFEFITDGSLDTLYTILPSAPFEINSVTFSPAITSYGLSLSDFISELSGDSYRFITSSGTKPLTIVKTNLTSDLAIINDRNESNISTIKKVVFFANVGQYQQLGFACSSIPTTTSFIGNLSICLPFDSTDGTFHGQLWQRPICIGNINSPFNPVINGSVFPGDFSKSCLLQLENISTSNSFKDITVEVTEDGVVYTTIFDTSILEPGESSTTFVFPILQASGPMLEIRFTYSTLSGTTFNFTYTISGGVISISPLTPQTVVIKVQGLDVGIPTASGSINDIAWNGSYFLCVGDWTTGSISKSFDGLLWSEPYNPEPIPYVQAIGTQILWDPEQNYWILRGSYAIQKDNLLPPVRSEDGINWIPMTFEDTVFGEASFIGGSPLLLTGTYVLEGAGVLLKSSDGVLWSDPIAMPNTAIANNAVVTGIAYDGTTYVLVGDPSGRITNERIFTSTDSVNWTEVIVNLSGFRGIYFNKNMFIAYGQFFSAPPNQTIQGDKCILYSYDGSNWIGPVGSTNGPVIIQTRVYDMDSNGTLFIAVGNFIQQLENDVVIYQMLKSTNGIDWTVDVTSQGFGARNIKWNGTYWLRVRIKEDGQSLLERSDDGESWEEINLGNNVTFVDIKSINWTGDYWLMCGKIILSGSDYSLARSIDGYNWTFLNDITTSQNIVARIGITRASTSPPINFFNAKSVYNGDIALEQTFYDPLQIIPGTPFRGGSLTTWSNSIEYGSGSVYQIYLYNNISFSNSFSFSFTPETTQMYLTVGCFQYYVYPVTIEITLDVGTAIDPIPPSSLVGPHFGWTNSLGHALIDEASVALGGVLMDTIPGELMEVLDEFQTPLEKVPEYSRQICRLDNGFNQSSIGLSPTPTKTVTPLPFWFSRGDPGCVLPIDALYVDEARITVRFRPVTGLYYTDSRVVDKSGNVVKSTIEGGSLWPIVNSPFYYIDPSGSAVPGLEPVLSPGTLVTQMPGIKMPGSYLLGDTYLLVEYVYLDKPEANRFRIADIQVPVVQHYTFDPYDNESNNFLRVPMFIPNPTRDLFFYCQRYEAPAYNAHFIGSRDLSNSLVPFAPWWPDASGLGERFYGTLRPGFSTRDSEPLRWLALTYEETLVRYSTENVALFRSMLPAMEQRKAPWVNRYYYNMAFGTQNGFTPFSMPIGQANLDKIQRSQLVLGFHGKTGCLTADYVDRYLTRIFAETYNILRIYGGRATMLFAY